MSSPGQMLGFQHQLLKNPDRLMPTLRWGNGLCGVVPLLHGLDLLLELDLPHLDVGNIRIPDALPHPIVSLYLLQVELLDLPHVSRLLAEVGVHLGVVN
jgi:hypothetical protein